MPSSPAASSRSLHGLDWTNFFVSDVRTGVGPFIAIHLSNMHWHVAQIGIALTVAEVAGVLTQAPGRALMDSLACLTSHCLASFRPGQQAIHLRCLRAFPEFRRPLTRSASWHSMTNSR